MEWAIRYETFGNAFKGAKNNAMVRAASARVSTSISETARTTITVEQCQNKVSQKYADARR